MSSPKEPSAEFWRDWLMTRDREINAWLNELALLAGELVAEIDDPDNDRAQLSGQAEHLHSRLWKMRHHFGFMVEPTKDGEAK